MILQNFVPHPRYYGAEPAEIAERSATGGLATLRRRRRRCPAWATPISLDDMRVLVREPAAS